MQRAALHLTTTIVIYILWKRGWIGGREREVAVLFREKEDFNLEREN